MKLQQNILEVGVLGSAQSVREADEPNPPSDMSRPLCVDLDGTLVKSDTLYDSLCQLLRGNPAAVRKLPGWLAHGKARVKSELAELVPLDAARLPYNEKLLSYLQVEKERGRKIYLVTGADHKLGAGVAALLGLFDGVLGSDGSTNLTGRQKLGELQQRFSQFDYIGNAAVDLPLLGGAVEPMVANPTRILSWRMRRSKLAPARVFLDRKPLRRVLVQALRVHQWAKNFLVFLPLLASHQLTRPRLLAAIACFFCFSFTASATYLVNDMLDVESDRHHATKRLRPFAAGELPVAAGIAIALLLAVAAAAILPFLPLAFALWLGCYVVATTAYSFYLKAIAIVDVLLLSGLYTVRMLAGGAATGVAISPWLGGFSCFLFLSLAMVKRFSELENLRGRGLTATRGRGYLVADIEQIRSFGTASAYAAVVVFSLYISRPDVVVYYRHAARLWLIVPVLLLWLSRIWLKASRGELHEDPVIFAFRDRTSLAIGLCVVVLAIFAL